VLPLKVTEYSSKVFIGSSSVVNVFFQSIYVGSPGKNIKTTAVDTAPNPTSTARIFRMTLTVLFILLIPFLFFMNSPVPTYLPNLESVFIVLYCHYRGKKSIMINKLTQ